MGNGLGMKEKDLHGLSGSGLRSEIILGDIVKKLDFGKFRPLADPPRPSRSLSARTRSSNPLLYFSDAGALKRGQIEPLSAC